MQAEWYILLVSSFRRTSMAKRLVELPIGIVQLAGCRCRCGHEWLPRDATDKPRVCPKCKSPNWDRPKLYERKTDEK